MRLTRVARAVAFAGAAVFMMAATASATTITFSTSPGTGFNGGGLSLNSSSGELATLAFVPDAFVSTGVPSNVNLGNFTLACATCTNTGLGATFSAFTFNLVVTDQTDGTSATFVGTSSGGVVALNQSTVTITWSPLQLGPGSGFNSTFFQISDTTKIVNPVSGAQIGSTTVQAFVDSPDAPSTTPEPATLGLVGIGLVGLGLVRRKKVIS